MAIPTLPAPAKDSLDDGDARLYGCLIAGLYLTHATRVTPSLPWFRAKIALILGIIVIGLLTSRQFKTFNASGRAGHAMGLFAGLVVFTLLTLVAVLTKF